jgi:glucose/arabinose dehydrogenase
MHPEFFEGNWLNIAMQGRLLSRRLALCSVSLGVLLSGCGDENKAPQFASSFTTSTPENVSTPFYTATARDPDGDALSYSIVGGADASRFTLNANGALSFVSPPDFERADDADADNVYRVQISASDGSLTDVLDLTATVTDLDKPAVVRIGSGFAFPLAIAPLPEPTGRLLVLERAGMISVLDPSTKQKLPTPFLDVADQTTTDGERGLLGFALAPDFASTGTFYILLTNLAGDVEIRRYRTLAENRAQANPASAELIILIPAAGRNIHNAGWLQFGPDNFLYTSVGEGGEERLAQDTNSLRGKVLRIDVSRDDFPEDNARNYAIPKNNPFVTGGGAPEVWAYGLRNPFRASFDLATGDLWIGDVGEGQREEVNLMRRQDGGANFGWNVLEGTAPYAGLSQPGLTAPVAEYEHLGPRNSITGGIVYRGQISEYFGQYFFADFLRNNVWSFPISRVSVGSTLNESQFISREQELIPDVGGLVNITGFNYDTRKNLIITTFNGEIFRLQEG